MKTYLLMLLTIASLGVAAQNNIEKTIATRANQKVIMNFKYPKLITYKLWDQNQIKIEAFVEINLGRNNEAFDITMEEKDGNIYINSEIKDYDKLPRNVIVKLGDREYMFEGAGWDNPELQKFLDENKGEKISWISNGVNTNVKLNISIPRNIVLDVEARHGLIEFQDMPTNVSAASRHGGIDISVPTSSQYNFELNTRHGEVFTNLNLDVTNDPDYRSHKWTMVVAKYNGGGPKAYFESRHGNIYLRSK